MALEASPHEVLYTPSAPGLSGAALRAELEDLGELSAGQLDTILAYAAQDGQLVAIVRHRGFLGRGWLTFQTVELATRLVYEHKLGPDGRAWHLGEAQPANSWTSPPPRATG